MKLTMKRSRALSSSAPKSRYFMASSLLMRPAEPPPMSAASAPRGVTFSQLLKKPAIIYRVGKEESAYYSLQG